MLLGNPCQGNLTKAVLTVSAAQVATDIKATTKANMLHTHTHKAQCVGRHRLLELKLNSYRFSGGGKEGALKLRWQKGKQVKDFTP